MSVLLGRHFCAAIFAVISFLVFVLVSDACFAGDGWIAGQFGEQLQTSVNNRDQNLSPNYGLAVGLETPRPNGVWGLALDFADQRDASALGNVSISRERVTVGLDLNFAPQFLIFERWSLYGLVGIAFFEDHVQTNIGTLTSTDYGTWEPIARVGVGLWYSPFDHFRLGSEIRVLDSAQLNPQVTGEMLVRAAYSY